MINLFVFIGLPLYAQTEALLTNNISVIPYKAKFLPMSEWLLIKINTNNTQL